ncbi:MAG: DUF935 family protein [Patescibacteria group bacterium]|nr:DUF935 family protein [Patescibacteria group bacterium]
MAETSLQLREIARPGLPLSQAGGLPPKRGTSVELISASPLDGKPINRGSVFTEELMPGLANYLRPQTAFQWWTLPYLSQITPQYVQQILIGGLAGMHVACWQLFDLMVDTNPEIRSCIGEYVDGICAKKIIIEPYHEEDQPPSPNAIRNQKIVSAALRNMVPDVSSDENNLRAVIRDIVFARFHGQSVQEIDYFQADNPDRLNTLDITNIGTIVAPRATFWVHPVCYAWDVTGRMGLRIPTDNLRQVTQNAKSWQPGSLPTDYGLANPLSFTGYTGSPRVQSVARFPANQFLVAVIKGKTGSALGASDLRPLAGIWVFENFALDFSMDNAQIFGIPFRVAYFEPSTSEADKNFVREMLQNMGSRAWALLPSSVKMEFEAQQRAGAETPAGYLVKICQEAYRKVILRQTMTGSGHGGAPQGSKGGMGIEQDVKAVCIQAGADYAADVLRDQFARSIQRVNVGNDSELPFIRLAAEEEGSLEDMQRDQIGAQIIDIGEDYFRRKYGYPKPAAGEKIASAPSAAAPGAPGAPAGEIKPPKPGGGKSPANPDEEMNASRRTEARRQRTELQAKTADDKTVGAAAKAIQQTLAPLVKYLRAGLEITDQKAQQEYFQRALHKWPELTKPLQHDTSLHEALTPAFVKSFVDGLQQKATRPTQETK